MKKNVLTGRLWLLLLLLLACTITGCQNKNEYSKDEIYQIYYKSADGTSLVSTAFGTHMEQLDYIVADILAQMQTQIPDNPDLVPAIPQNLTIQSTDTKTKSYAIISFSSDYLKLSRADELLCRAAITLTLTQLPEIENVEIMVNDKVIKNSDDSEVGSLSGNSFITDDNMRLSKEKHNVILYFPDESGKMLAAEEQTSLIEGEVAPEEIILNQLLEGPNKESLKPLFPDDVKILNHSIKNGTCYVNFDSSFIQNPPEVNAQLVIYGIVNSLCELKEVSSVQFLVEGNSDVKYANEISLKDPFSRDGSLVLTTD